MPVSKSTIIEDQPQIDGRRAVREHHEFADGSYEDVTYFAEPKADVEAMLPIRAAQLNDAETERLNRPPPEKFYAVSEIEAAFAKVAPALDVKLLTAELAGDEKLILPIDVVK